MYAKSVYGDVVSFAYPNPDDPRLARIHKKGFVDELRSLSEEEIFDLAKLFVVWRDRKLRGCPVLEFEDGTVAVAVPKVRALRKDYYAWVKDLELPKMYYRLVTLTLYRHYGFIFSWANINHWVSECLHRVRVNLRRSYGVEIAYIWVIEVHRDGWPHVHIILGLSDYVPALRFEVLLDVFRRAWIDDEGNPLCALHGIDIRYIGRCVEDVKAYVLKYLTKGFWEIWEVSVEGGWVSGRLSAMLIWLFKVRLLGMSHNIKRPAKEGGQKKGKVVYHGRVSLYLVYVRVGYDVPYDLFKREFLRRGILRFENRYLVVFIPSVVHRFEDADEEDDLYKELIEGF